MHRQLLFMGDFNDIQFQPILQDIAGDTVVPLGADNQANLQNSRVRITNNREWSEGQKQNSGDRPLRKKEREEFHETY